ncbi:MAG: hypothetical protein M1812_004411 [Candelaria pacifica]|nr:MAG: hypothetical protein M1812_004411 [Candelaria pacifica]
MKAGIDQGYSQTDNRQLNVALAVLLCTAFVGSQNGRRRCLSKAHTNHLHQNTLPRVFETEEEMSQLALVAEGFTNGAMDISFVVLEGNDCQGCLGAKDAQ